MTLEINVSKMLDQYEILGYGRSIELRREKNDAGLQHIFVDKCLTNP